MVRFTCGMIGVWTVTSWTTGFLILGQTARLDSLGPADLATTETWASLLPSGRLAGLAAGLVASVLELKVFPRHARRVGVGAMLFWRTLGNASVASLGVLAIVYAIATGKPGAAFLDVVMGPSFRAFVKSTLLLQIILTFVIVSFLINVVLQVSRLVGPGAASQVFLGGYLRQVHEDCSFLFINLVNSTGIAERIRHLRVRRVQERCFHDVAEPVLDTRGRSEKRAGRVGTP